jgi:hypothetical protein
VSREPYSPINVRLAQGPKQVNQRQPVTLKRKALTTQLVLILVLDLLIGGCPRSFGQVDDPGLLNQQVTKLYKVGKYREVIPIAERVLEIDKYILGPEDTAIVTAIDPVLAGPPPGQRKPGASTEKGITLPH